MIPISLYDQYYFNDPSIPLAIFLPSETVLVLMTLSTFMAVISVTKLLFDDCRSEAYFPLVIGVGYGLGKIVKFIDEEHSFDEPKAFSNPILIYLCQAFYVFSMTNGVDYHSVGRNLFLLLALSLLSSVVTMLGLLFFGFHILHKSQNWAWNEVFLLTSTLLPLEVDATLKELNRAYGYLRNMEQLLLGERIMTLAVTSALASAANSNAVKSLLELNFGIFITMEILWAIAGLLITGCFTVLSAFLLRKTVDHLKKQVLVAIVSPVFIMLFSRLMSFPIASVYVALLGICLNSVRPKADPLFEQFMAQVWDFLAHTSKLVMYTLTGMLLALRSDPNDSIGDMGVAFLFYLMVMFFRSVVHLGVYTIVILNSSQIVTWRQAFLSIWGAYDGMPNLYFALSIYYNHASFGRIFLYVAIIVLYSNFFNAVLMNYMFSLVGMYDLTRSRIVNMNNGLFKINNCRINAMFSLKMDRIISDSNWLIVEIVTRMPHPYKRTIKSMGEDLGMDDHKLRTITCDNCGLTVLAPPSKKELEDFVYEAKLRILKAIMVMLTKQYENGTLSLNCLRVLINMVETATLKPDPTVEPADLKITRIGTSTQVRMKILFAWLYEKMSIAHDFIPRNKIRYFCYKLCMSQTFQLVMVTLTLVDIILALHLLVDFSKDFKTITFKENFANFLQIADVTFYLVFAVEFMIQILGIGVNQYFRNHVNKIEFGNNILIRTCEVSVFLARCSKDSQHCSLFDLNQQDFKFIMVLKYFLLLRVTRFYIFLAALVPRIRHCIDNQILECVQRSYDSGKAYLMALDRVCKSLGHIVENQAAFEVLKKKLEEDRLAVTKELGQIQREYPSIAATSKTRHAVRYIINTMEGCVDDMKEEGVLDQNEHKSVMIAIGELKFPLGNLDHVAPCPPDFIIKSIPWLQNDQEAVNFLLNNAELVNFDYNDVIIQQGDDPIGLYVLVSGLVRNIYRPTPTVVQLSSKFGVLPNYDFFSNLNFDQQQEEYIGAGNLIGEIGLVTGRRYDMTTVCETATQVYFIPLESIREQLFETEVGARLRGRIWKSIGVRIAELLFRSDHLVAHDWSLEKLFVYLEKSIAPDLTGVTRVNFKNYMSEVILIEGVAMDPETRTKFYAPIHIPRSVNGILLPEHEDWDFQTVYQTQILIIPNEFVDEQMINDRRTGVFVRKVEEMRPRDALKAGRATAIRDTSQSEVTVSEHFRTPTPSLKQQDAHEKKFRVGFRTSSTSLIEEKEKKSEKNE